MEKRKTVLSFAAIAAAITVIAILLLDRPLAVFIRNSNLGNAWLFTSGTSFFDKISGKEISKFLLGFILIGIGIILLIIKQTRLYSFPLLFIGLSQFTSTLLAGVSKNLFGRLRPYELLANNGSDHAWFAGGGSFPSGHTGFYFGLFLPLAYLFPRWWLPLMIVPFFIAIARIAANDHFLSDVTASMALAALVTSAFASLMKGSLNS